MERHEMLNEISNLAKRISAPKSLLPNFEPRSELPIGRYVEIKNDAFHSVVMERGKEVKRDVFENFDDFLFHIFEYITSVMATEYEFRNRNHLEDSRRKVFSAQEELIKKLNPLWGNKIIERHRLILDEYPFDDFVNQRLEYLKELRKQGVHENLLWQLACEKYPIPV